MKKTLPDPNNLELHFNTVKRIVEVYTRNIKRKSGVTLRIKFVNHVGFVDRQKMQVGSTHGVFLKNYT